MCAEERLWIRQQRACAPKRWRCVRWCDVPQRSFPAVWVGGAVTELSTSYGREQRQPHGLCSQKSIDYKAPSGGDGARQLRN